MPDFARFLPLSQRAPGDESGVDGDRRQALAVVVEQAAALTGSARGQRAERAATFADAAGLRTEYDAVAETDPLPRLRALAMGVRTGRRRSIRALADGVRALLVLAREMNIDATLDPLTAGSVALWAAGRAPLERRAVVRGHTVRASDADWAFGRGPVLTGTATGIAAFLLGVSDDAPAQITPQ